MIAPRLGLYAVYEPPEEGWQDYPGQLDRITSSLRAAGIQVLLAPEPVKDPASCERVAAWLESQSLDLLHPLIVTWSFDHYTVRIQQVTRLPVAIRSIPGIRTGSVVGGQQLQSVFYDLGVEHRLFYGPLEDPATTGQVAVYARACALKKSLAGARIAVIGRRTEGMTPTAVDEMEILRLFGARLLNYGLDEFTSLAGQESNANAQEEWKRIALQARTVTSRPEHGIAAARNLLALQKMVADLGLQAISIGSYPECQGTMCLPIALLNEGGVAAGCEGDVNSTLAIYLLSQLSDAPVHFGEMLALDFEDSSIVTSHCGCGSPSLADESGFTLCPVRLANDGVCIRYSARPGPVTFVNLTGRKGNYRMCAFEGQAVPTGMVFEGTPLKFVTRTPLEKIWQAVSAGGFGHHWMTAYTHAAAELSEFCRLSGVRGVFPDLDQERLWTCG
jgi:L-fucose isomerase-like protein